MYNLTTQVNQTVSTVDNSRDYMPQINFKNDKLNGQIQQKVNYKNLEIPNLKLSLLNNDHINIKERNFA